MLRKYVRAGLAAGLLLFPTWTSVHAIEVPLPRLELVPWTAVQPEPVGKTPAPRMQSDEAIRDKDTPHRRLPFLYDVMPAEEDREEQIIPRNDVLDIRGA